MDAQRSLILTTLLLAACGEPAAMNETGDGATTPPYVRDPRWSTPARPRNDLLVIDITDRFAGTSTSSEDPLALTA